MGVAGDERRTTRATQEAAAQSAAARPWAGALGSRKCSERKLTRLAPLLDVRGISGVAEAKIAAR